MLDHKSLEPTTESKPLVITLEQKLVVHPTDDGMQHLRKTSEPKELEPTAECTPLAITSKQKMVVSSTDDGMQIIGKALEPKALETPDGINDSQCSILTITSTIPAEKKPATKINKRACAAVLGSSKSNVKSKTKSSIMSAKKVMLRLQLIHL